MELKSIIAAKGSPVALVIGNGINRFSGTGNSWDDLLKRLARKFKPGTTLQPSGISLTEFYDVLELSTSEKALQNEFCQLMNSWAPGDQHRRIVNWAQTHDAPILTTNFETTFADCGGFKPRRTMKGKFTAFYPWETYFGSKPITEPCRNFGIWHVNGTQHYRQSIRLGLTHYMGSVQRARSWLYRGSNQLFAGENEESWRGATSWLQIIFGSNLVIFGLGLNENEVFLRWLLIERARYFRKFPKFRRKAWYVQNGAITDEGKRFFLKGVGVQAIEVNSLDDIYGEAVWE